MTDYNAQLTKLLNLRAKVDRAIQAEADRQGIDLEADELDSYSHLIGTAHGERPGIGYIVLPHPDLAHAAAQLAAAAERWGTGRG